MSTQTMNAKELETLAEDMGVTIDEAKTILGLNRPSTNNFKKLKSNAAFRVVATKDKVVTNPRTGEPQWQITFQVMDANNQPIKGAVSTGWVGLGLNTDGFKYTDVEQQERAFRAASGILRAASDKFAAVGRIVKDGDKKRYFDANDNELTPDQTSAAFVQSKVASIRELRAQLQGAGSVKLAGVELLAINEAYVSKKTGKEGTQLRLLPPGSEVKYPLIDDPAELFEEDSKA